MLVIKHNPELIIFLGLFLLSVFFYFISNHHFKKRIKENLSQKTLRGDSVQSYGEKVIADFLFKNKIEYVYDKPVRLSIRQRTVIRPDFYLPVSDIYIEYWGMAGNEEYDHKSRWKKNLYNKFKKRLIDLYAHQVKSIPSILKKELGL
ncbi:MAG: hypothetical protein KKH98_07540 [Spirochaetes bacterium]|nr:hypothetical protein [Spirochaetota bacterium]